MTWSLTDSLTSCPNSSPLTLDVDLRAVAWHPPPPPALPNPYPSCSLQLFPLKHSSPDSIIASSHLPSSLFSNHTSYPNCLTKDSQTPTILLFFSSSLCSYCLPRCYTIFPRVKVFIMFIVYYLSLPIPATTSSLSVLLADVFQAHVTVPGTYTVCLLNEIKSFVQ